KRVAIGDVKIAHRGYGHIELDWVDVAAKQACRHTAAKNVFDACDQGQGKFGDLARLAQVAPALKVLIVDEGDIVLVLLKKRESEVDQFTHRRDGLAVIEIEPLFGRADLGVHVLEGRKVEPVLVAEIGI